MLPKFGREAAQAEASSGALACSPIHRQLPPGFGACCLLGSILSSHHPLEVSTMREIQLRDAKASRATRKSADLAAWLETVLHLYGDRILAFDTPTARIAGVLFRNGSV